MAKKKGFKQNDNNLAITYSRFSSHAQNEESIEQQQKRANEYADAHGYHVVKEYADYALSGQNDDRPQYQLMLSEVKTLKPAVLIMWKNDRLGRDVLELQLAKRAIRAAGCKIELVSEVAPDAETSQGKLVEHMMDAVAQFWSDTSRENIRRSQQEMAKAGKSLGHKIFGYKVGSERKYEIDGSTAPIVKRIFNDYANGKPMQDIANELNDQGLRSSTGSRFTVNGLRSILHNDRYIGVYKYGEVRIDGGMPSIIDRELYDNVQKMFALNKRGNKKPTESHRYWLSGKLYCGHCGEPMQGVSGTSKSKGQKHFYYYCAKHRKHQCDKKNVRANEIENIVIDILNEILNDSEQLTSLAVDAHYYYKEYHKETKYLESLEAELKNTEKALQNIVKAIEAGIFSDTTQEAILKREEEKKALLEAIQVEEVKRSMIQDEYSIKAYFNKFAHVDFEDANVRDSVLEYFIDKIFVYDDKVVFVGCFTDDKWEVTLEDIERAEGTEKSGFDDFVLGSTKNHYKSAGTL